jgi:hypothetical protein
LEKTFKFLTRLANSPKLSTMYLVPIAWLYVTLMMAVVEAASPNGTLLGGIVTFTLYGAVPISIVLYIMGAPGRRRGIKAREQAELAAASMPPDAHGEAAANPITSVREKA